MKKKFVALLGVFSICFAIAPWLSSVNSHASTEPKTICSSIGVPVSDGSMQEQIDLLLDTYFSARCTLDATYCSAMLSNIVRQGIINDEHERIALLNNAGVVEMTNLYAVTQTEHDGAYILYHVTETVKYNTEQYNIDHLIAFVVSEENLLYIARDEYCEEFLSFESNAVWHYIESSMARSGSNNDLADNTHSNTGDQAYDLVEVARTQVGYHEKSSVSQLEYKTANSGYNNFTKYEQWYMNYGTWPSDAEEGQEWCAMFVSWCANQASIPTNTVPKERKVNKFKLHYETAGFEISQADGGTYIPKMGDIIIFSSHVGIVVSADEDNIVIIDGNHTNQVCLRSIQADNADIYCFGTPTYPDSDENGNSVHNWSASFEHDNDNHWKICIWCGKQTEPLRHVWKVDSSGNFKTCRGCGLFVNLIVIQSKRPSLLIKYSTVKEDEK